MTFILPNTVAKAANGDTVVVLGSASDCWRRRPDGTCESPWRAVGIDGKLFVTYDLEPIEKLRQLAERMEFDRRRQIAERGMK